MSEPNQVLWRGIRPVDPPEAIPVLPYTPGAIQHRTYGVADNSDINLLTVPAGHTYHIINMFGNCQPDADGVGYIELISGAGHILLVFGFYFSDASKMSCPPIVLMAPIDVLENEYIKVYSLNTDFKVYCSIIYTKD